MERLYSVGPVHLSLEGVLCHRREQRRRHRDREGGDVKQGGRGEMQIEGATAIVIFRSRRAERMEKNRAGVQGRHFLRVKTLGKRRRKKKEKRREREREGKTRISLTRSRVSNKKNAGSENDVSPRIRRDITYAVPIPTCINFMSLRNF